MDVGINDLVVYPNPTNGMVNLMLENVEYVEVFDVVGRKVLDEFVVSQSLDFSILSEGSYIIVVKNDKGIYSSKILISK